MDTIERYCYYLVHRRIPDEYVEHLVKVFSGMGYYIMEPNKAKMRKKLNVARIYIVKNQTPPKTDYVFDCVTDMVDRIVL